MWSLEGFFSRSGRAGAAPIKPLHDDDDGHVVQWLRAWVPSNFRSCRYGITREPRIRWLKTVDKFPGGASTGRQA